MGTFEQVDAVFHEPGMSHDLESSDRGKADRDA
jgi:hypothetical protein